MGCLKITALIVGVLAIGLAYFLYQPLPDYLEDKRTLQLVTAKIKLSFICSEILYRLGSGDRWTHIRKTLKNSLFDERYVNFTGLNVYDTCTEFGGVGVRVYRPKHFTKAAPCFIYLHGGSWSFLDAETYDISMSDIAREADVMVISLQYRRSPEHPFPTPFDDSYKAIKSILENGGKYGVDTNHVGIGGDSAGGNIAAAVLLKLRNERIKPEIKAHVSVYAVLQLCDFTLPVFLQREMIDPNFTFQALFLTSLYLNLTSEQTTLFSGGNFSTPELDRLCRKYVDLKHLPDEFKFDGYRRRGHLAPEVNEDVRRISEIVSNPYVSPLLAEDMRGLPPALILSMGWDILGDEGWIYGGRLREAGVQATNLHFKGASHGCLNFHHLKLKSCENFFNSIVEFLRKRLH